MKYRLKYAQKRDILELDDYGRITAGSDSELQFFPPLKMQTTLSGMPLMRYGYDSDELVDKELEAIDNFLKGGE